MAQGVDGVPPPFDVTMFDCVGTARSMELAPYPPQSSPSFGADVLTQRTFETGRVHGAGSSGSTSNAPPLPEAIVTNKTLGWLMMALRKPTSRSAWFPNRAWKTITRAPRPAAQSIAAAWMNW